MMAISVKRGAARFAGFDILKFICAFLVVCIHVPFPGIFGEYFDVFSRMAVPIFFMITGFFYTDTVKRGRVRMQIKKIFWLTVGANLFFLVYKCAFEAVFGDGLGAYLSQTFTFDNLVGFLFLNESPLSGNLWYLGAILYVLLVAAAVEKFGKREWLYYSIPVLLIINLVLGEFSPLLFGEKFSAECSRNFLFMGLPYFSLGMLIRSKKKLRSAKPAAAAAIVLAVLSLSERWILFAAGVDELFSNYIFTALLSAAIFMMFRAFYAGRTTNKCEKVAAKIGKNYSAFVYIFHPIFITALSFMKKSGVLAWFLPFAVYAATIVAASAVFKITAVVKARRKN